MTQEIVYTSAPEGLKPGSKGFCTVVSTDGMSGNLSERLEMLSGYRHAFTPGDRNAPVNYRHLHIKVSGNSYSVLSRISDAGLDYSQRSNKLAHHVALDASELIAAGPAAVLASPGFCESRWDGTVRTIASGRLPDTPTSGPQVCRHWQSLTGDAAWAGVLAHAATVARPKPVSVIFPAGCDTLALVVEALNLLPPSRRWNVTFSTYYTKAIAGSDCLWRFVLDGTKQAGVLRNDPHALVIDLVAPLSAPPDNSYAGSARTGTPAADYTPGFAAARGASGTAPVQARTPIRQMRPAKVPQPAADQRQFDGADEFVDYGADYGMPAMPPKLPRRQRWYRKTTIIVLGSIVTLCAVAGLLFMLLQSRSVPVPPVEDVSTETPEVTAPVVSSQSTEPQDTDPLDAAVADTSPDTSPPDEDIPVTPTAASVDTPRLPIRSRPSLTSVCLPEQSPLLWHTTVTALSFRSSYRISLPAASNCMRPIPQRLRCCR